LKEEIKDLTLFQLHPNVNLLARRTHFIVKNYNGEIISDMISYTLKVLHIAILIRTPFYLYS
jgi:hypothetical protein